MISFWKKEEGVVIIYPDYTIDILKVLDNSYIHKQIEQRGNFRFMRLKKRSILKVR